MIQKILRYAEHLGLDKEELLQMMWKEVKQIG